MRQMRDPLLGAPALGDVVDDVDQIPVHASLVGNPDPLGRDEALALDLRREYVEEQAVGAGQRLFVVRRELVGDFRRKQFERLPADDLLAWQPELRFGHAIGPDVTAIAQVLHGDLCRDVIDDLAQERIIAVAFLFEVSALRDVFDRGQPTRPAPAAC